MPPPLTRPPYRIADIGFRGLRLRRRRGSVEGYEVRVGGTQTRFGEVVGDFAARDCPAVARALLDTFLAQRRGDEALSDCVARVGAEPFVSAVRSFDPSAEVAPAL